MGSFQVQYVDRVRRSLGTRKSIGGLEEHPVLNDWQTQQVTMRSRSPTTSEYNIDDRITFVELNLASRIELTLLIHKRVDCRQHVPGAVFYKRTCGPALSVLYDNQILDLTTLANNAPNHHQVSRLFVFPFRFLKDTG